MAVWVSPHHTDKAPLPVASLPQEICPDSAEKLGVGQSARQAPSPQTPDLKTSGI